jgi:hypothetical protein
LPIDDVVYVVSVDLVGADMHIGSGQLPIDDVV